VKSKDAMKMLNHLKIKPQQAQSLIDAKLTTNKKLIRFLKKIVTTSPPKEKKETKPKKKVKKK
jgi:ribosomal protein S6